jgi:hypothetical protein
VPVTAPTLSPVASSFPTPVPSTAPLPNCPAGYFGEAGEECTPCGSAHEQPEGDVSYFPQGFDCKMGNMTNPTSRAGWFISSEVVPSLLCSPQSQKMREICPAALPCYPSGACLGDNVCDVHYGGDRCAECARGAVRVNGHCTSCTAAYISVGLVVTAAIVFAASIGYKYAYHSLDTGYTVMVLHYMLRWDYLQVLGLLGVLSQHMSSGALRDTLEALTVFNLNPAFIMSDCFGQSALFFGTLERVQIVAYMFYVVNALPLVLLLLFTFEALLRAVLKGRTRRCTLLPVSWLRGWISTKRSSALRIHPKILLVSPREGNSSDSTARSGPDPSSTVHPELRDTAAQDAAMLDIMMERGEIHIHEQLAAEAKAALPAALSLKESLVRRVQCYATCMAVLYSLLCVNALSVFDCRATSPDDGYRYLAAVGPTAEGRCYEPGSVQRSLVPWALAALVVYGLGVPALVYAVWRCSEQSNNSKVRLSVAPAVVRDASPTRSSGVPLFPPPPPAVSTLGTAHSGTKAGRPPRPPARVHSAASAAPPRGADATAPGHVLTLPAGLAGKFTKYKTAPGATAAGQTLIFPYDLTGKLTKHRTTTERGRSWKRPAAAVASPDPTRVAKSAAPASAAVAAPRACRSIDEQGSGGQNASAATSVLRRILPLLLRKAVLMVVVALPGVLQQAPLQALLLCCGVLSVSLAVQYRSCKRSSSVVIAETSGCDAAARDCTVGTTALQFTACALVLALLLTLLCVTPPRMSTTVTTLTVCCLSVLAVSILPILSGNNVDQVIWQPHSVFCKCLLPAVRARQVKVSPIRSQMDDAAFESQPVVMKPGASKLHGSDPDDHWEILSTTSRGSEEVHQSGQSGLFSAVGMALRWHHHSKASPPAAQSGGNALASKASVHATRDIEQGLNPTQYDGIATVPLRDATARVLKTRLPGPRASLFPGWGKMHRYRVRAKLTAVEALRERNTRQTRPVGVHAATAPRFKLRWNKHQKVMPALNN